MTASQMHSVCLLECHIHLLSLSWMLVFWLASLAQVSDALQASDKQDMASSSGAIARQLVQQESRVESSQTYDYLLKTSAQASSHSRCRSIVEVKRL